jgi:thiol-disulfide isomerase/thioredoxin
VGVEPSTLAPLRGRTWVLVFLSTSCPHCREALPALGALAARLGPRGLTVLGLATEERREVEAFVREAAVGFPVASVPLSVVRDYEVQRYPRVFLVDAIGRIAWEGLPEGLEDAAALHVLGRFPAPPATSAALSWASALRLERRLGDLVVGLRRFLAAEGVDPTDASTARAWLEALEREAVARLGAASEDALWGRAYDAWLELASVGAEYAASDVAARAAEEVRTLLAEREAAREVDAGRALEALRRGAGLLPFRVAAERYRGVAARYEDTAAGRLALVLAVDCENGGGRPSFCR